MRSAAAGLVPHPAAGMAPVWTDADAARFIGLDPRNRANLAKARRVLDRLHDDRVARVERTRRGLRLYGPDGKLISTAYASVVNRIRQRSQPHTPA